MEIQVRSYDLIRSRGMECLFLAYVSIDGYARLMIRSWDGPWRPFVAPLPALPCRHVVVADNHTIGLVVFAIDLDGIVAYTWRTADGWTPWRNLQTGLSLNPVHELRAAMNQDGRLEVFARAGGSIYHLWQKAPNKDNWSSWQDLNTPHNTGPLMRNEKMTPAGNKDGTRPDQQPPPPPPTQKGELIALMNAPSGDPDWASNPEWRITLGEPASGGLTAISYDVYNYEEFTVEIHGVTVPRKTTTENIRREVKGDWIARAHGTPPPNGWPKAIQIPIKWQA